MLDRTMKLQEIVKRCVSNAAISLSSALLLSGCAPRYLDTLHVYSPARPPYPISVSNGASKSKVYLVGAAVYIHCSRLDVSFGSEGRGLTGAMRYLVLLEDPLDQRRTLELYDFSDDGTLDAVTTSPVSEGEPVTFKDILEKSIMTKEHEPLFQAAYQELEKWRLEYTDEQLKKWRQGHDEERLKRR